MKRTIQKFREAVVDELMADWPPGIMKRRIYEKWVAQNADLVSREFIKGAGASEVAKKVLNREMASVREPTAEELEADEKARIQEIGLEAFERENREFGALIEGAREELEAHRRRRGRGTN